MRSSSRRRWIAWLVAAAFVSGAVALCSGRVDRVADTRLWVYDLGGGPRAGVDIEVEIARDPLDPSGAPPAAFVSEARTRTDAAGRAVLQRVTERRFYVPMPHGAGPRGWVQRFAIGVASPPPRVFAPAARVLQIGLGPGNRGYALAMQHDYDVFRDQDAFSAACVAKANDFGLARRYLEVADGPDVGPRAREAILAQARARGLKSFLDPSGVYVVLDEAPAVHCTLRAVLTDLEGRPVPGFSEP